MKCPHCGKEISDFALSCPNCGGNPKEEATEEVKTKVKNAAQKVNRRNYKLSLTGAIIAFVVAIIVPFYFTRIVRMGWFSLNSITESIIYAIVAVALIVIASKCHSFSIVKKNTLFYGISVVVAIADFILQYVYFKVAFGNDIINLMKQQMKPAWVIFNITKLLHILVLIVGIALIFTIIKQRKEDKANDNK